MTAFMPTLLYAAPTSHDSLTDAEWTDLMHDHLQEAQTGQIVPARPRSRLGQVPPDTNAASTVISEHVNLGSWEHFYVTDITGSTINVCHEKTRDWLTKFFWKEIRSTLQVNRFFSQAQVGSLIWDKVHGNVEAFDIRQHSENELVFGCRFKTFTLGLKHNPWLPEKHKMYMRCQSTTDYRVLYARIDADGVGRCYEYTAKEIKDRKSKIVACDGCSTSAAGNKASAKRVVFTLEPFGSGKTIWYLHEQAFYSVY